MEELGAADMAMAVSLSVHILSQYPVVTWGTDEQHARWLPAMLAGEALGAFALTEPHAGSDAAAIRTRAERVGPADAPTAYRLTGTKIWISNAPEADRYLVFATLDPAAGPKAITAFLVEKGTPGFRFGAHEQKMGIRSCPAAELVFDGCEVPVANRLGGEGEGYRIALSALGGGADLDRRRLRRDRPGRRSRRRPRYVHAAPGVRRRRWPTSRACDSCSPRWPARWPPPGRSPARRPRAKDRGEPLAEVSSLAKWTASDAAMRVATDAVQLFGASGYSRETGVERLMRDAKGAQIYEGTNQIHRLIVAEEVLRRA